MRILAVLSFLLLPLTAFAVDDFCTFSLSTGSAVVVGASTYVLTGPPVQTTTVNHNRTATQIYNTYIDSISSGTNKITSRCFRYQSYNSSTGYATGVQINYESPTRLANQGETLNIVTAKTYQQFLDYLLAGGVLSPPPDPDPPPPTEPTLTAIALQLDAVISRLNIVDNKLDVIDNRIAQMDPTILTQTVSFLIGAFIAIAFVISSSLRF